MNLPDYFWARTKTTDCIIWTGAQNSRGYGCFAVDGKSELAHRLAYMDKVGPIPDGMTIDHLCRVHSCVNPDHLEVVTQGENNRRAGLRIGGLCKRGHEITEANLYINSKGRKECDDCRRIQRANLRDRDRTANAHGSRAIRAWAVENGYNVPPRGNLPGSIRDAYLDAHNLARKAAA